MKGYLRLSLRLCLLRLLWLLLALMRLLLLKLQLLRRLLCILFLFGFWVRLGGGSFDGLLFGWLILGLWLDLVHRGGLFEQVWDIVLLNHIRETVEAPRFLVLFLLLCMLTLRIVLRLLIFWNCDRLVLIFLLGLGFLGDLGLFLHNLSCGLSIFSLILADLLILLLLPSCALLLVFIMLVYFCDLLHEDFNNLLKFLVIQSSFFSIFSGCPLSFSLTLGRLLCNHHILLNFLFCLNVYGSIWLFLHIGWVNFSQISDIFISNLSVHWFDFCRWFP